MSRYDSVEENMSHLKNRIFRFSGSFQLKKRKFTCNVCQGTGYKGYLLKDSKGQIRVGETCLKENFSISAI